MKKYLVRKWDNLVYKMAVPSFNRIIRDNPGICYLFILHMESALERNPISPELKLATEKFFEEIDEHLERTTGK